MSIFLFLSWIAIITALASRRSAKKPQLLLPGQVDQSFSTAQQQHDHGALVRYYRLALEKPIPGKDAQLVRINLAFSLTALEEYSQAIEELDKVSLTLLYPNQVVLWLNNRAYNLTKLKRYDEALEHLQDAQELLIGEENLSKNAILSSCIHGTRGIIFFEQGDLDRAEKSIELALRLETDGTAHEFDNVKQEGDPARTAERYFWLSQISKQRGDETIYLQRLKKAAMFPTSEFGRKAISLLMTKNELRSSDPQKPYGFNIPNVKKLLQS